MTVKPKRHLAKALTWRIIASLTTFLIGWLVTGNLNFGMAIGFADVVIKIALYYLHERAWYHSQFGIVHDEEKVAAEAKLQNNKKEKHNMTGTEG
ncbi:MAG: DUF2061 domain-containing protein [Prolixibacteraceae bacterium]|jgi:uncharacterized membrane protein|nr:DUF2061 domain-containing protein [Prolixibacteraceae bacterium]